MKRHIKNKTPDKSDNTTKRKKSKDIVQKKGDKIYRDKIKQ